MRLIVWYIDLSISIDIFEFLGMLTAIMPSGVCVRVPNIVSNQLPYENEMSHLKYIIFIYFK